MSDSDRIHDVRVTREDWWEADACSLDLMVAVGDRVTAGAPIACIGVNKVTVDLVAPVSGVVVAVADVSGAEEVIPGTVAVRILETVSPSEVERPRSSAVRASPVAAVTGRVDLTALDERQSRLKGENPSLLDAACLAVSIVRSFATVPGLLPPGPVAVAYVSIRSSLETSSLVRVSVDDDEGDVRPHDAGSLYLPTVQLIRFHDTVERVQCPPLQAPTVSIGAPFPQPAFVGGRFEVVARAEVTFQHVCPPRVASRVLAALTEQIERA